MLYNTCPTCGFFLGNVTKQFEDEKYKVCNDSNLTEEEIEDKIKKIIMKLPLRRYCCRMRVMTYKDYVYDLVAPDEDL